MPDDTAPTLKDLTEDMRQALVSNAGQLRTEFRKRKSDYAFRSVPTADIKDLIGSGWEVYRQGKRQTRLKKKKRHEQMLEDRLWCLLYKMGYPSISQERLYIIFEQDDGTRGKKYINVFSRDDETAFVIECHSRENRGRRSLQKDLHETIHLQEYVRKAIYQAGKNQIKPKIIWAYATNNIIWSEADIEKASSSGINIITENEVQYYEAFTKHMGPAGRYQILGEFLKGQKVPALANVRVPAIRGRVGGETFYSFVTTPRRLLKVSFVNHQALNHPDGRPAYQRMVSSSRLKEIGKFISQGGYFPTNILVNFVERPKFDLISNKQNTDENIKFGWLSLPTVYRSAWIIDGQHRLYGYSFLDDHYLDQSLFVIAFDRMSTVKEADLFITINHKQKSVPKSLLVSLLADLRLGDPDPKSPS